MFMNSDESFFLEPDSEQNPVEAGDKDYEAALNEALGEGSRSLELRDMIMTLKVRYRRMSRDLESTEGVEHERLQRDLNKLAEQIRVLAEEAEITRFVEDAVRVGVEMRRMESS
jgi:hypothetical protein